MSKTISNKGLDLIKHFEGFRSKPYKDVGGVPTIGYGSTFYEDGTKVSMVDPAISEEQATQLLKNIVKPFENAVNQYVTYPINQNMFDALVSLCYNIGAGAFKKSTLVKLLNQGDVKGASEQFAWWNRVGGRVNKGLANRRAKEAELFLA